MHTVVVVDRDDLDRSRLERVPHAAQGGIAFAVVGHAEARLVAKITRRPVPELVLMVARGGHPWPVARRDFVVEKEVTPGLWPVWADVCVAQVAIEQMEQWLHPLDLRRVVA
jgi:hypothetical protein